MQILSNPISALNIRESPKFSRLLGNRGRRTRWWRQILDRKWKYGRFAHAQWKRRNIILIYGRIAEIPASFRKSGSRNIIRDINLPEAIQYRSQDALRVHYRQITYEVTLISSEHYKNSSVIVDLAMGQIPRSTERISSFFLILLVFSLFTVASLYRVQF